MLHSMKAEVEETRFFCAVLPPFHSISEPRGTSTDDFFQLTTMRWARKAYTWFESWSLFLSFDGGVMLEFGGNGSGNEPKQ